MSPTCAISTCDGEPYCWGWCRAHYDSWLRYADPLLVQKRVEQRGETSAALLDRLCAIETDDCVLWPRSVDTRPGFQPYGRATVGRRRVSVHVEALTRRAGPRPLPAMQAAHSCGNASCLNYRHLRWATAGENAADKEQHGRVRRGPDHQNSKLTLAQVADIRRAHAAGEATQKELAARYGLSQPGISKIIRRVTYSLD